jgi:hypothetical protein
MYVSPKIFTVTVQYPNPTHNRTETFDFENEAYKFFMELYDERKGKCYNGLWMIEIETSKHQVHMQRLWKRPAA